MEDQKRVAWSQTGTELLQVLGSDVNQGLSEAEAKKRLETYGPNALAEEKREPIWLKVLRQLQDFTVIVLIIASIVSAFTGDMIEALLIIAIVVVNALLGVLQEGRAEKAVEALQKMTSPSARVLRSGKQMQVDAAELVPGDIVFLDAGDIVPADVRLLASSNLKVEEAALTGESVPVDKDATLLLDEKTDLAERKNMLYSATAVAYGSGHALVVATGQATEVGRIAGGLTSIEREETPLQKSINHLGKMLGTICLVIVVLTFFVGLLRRGNPMDLFMTSVSLAVAAIPEGLPAVVTIVLALGMNRMAKKNAIVKRLLAVETLGSVNVICSDKTGTLTQNEMTVTQVYAGGHRYEVEGIGYAPEGQILEIQGEKRQPLSLDEEAHQSLKRLLEIALLCNDAALREENGVWSILGDPTEGALLTLGAKEGIRLTELKESHPLIGKLPFDSTRKMMSVFHDGFEQQPLALTKGAPDLLLAECDRELIDGEVKPLTEARRKEIMAQNQAYAKQALRVLAFAYKVHPQGFDDAEKQMIFVGLVGMIDPARKEAKDAIAICKEAGIRVVMITGDHMDTAAAIADQLGIMREGNLVISGRELEEMSDEDLLKIIPNVAVFARVSPEHKVRIVRLLRESGAICSMTGDGVNDAPALKQADIGVAMGITGTEVAKGAADMILTDDNFASIVSAVEEGRTIYGNIRKFVGFLLSCNVGEILVIFLCMMLLGPEMVPLLPVQLLWLNLITDSFPALALGQELGEADLMRRPPRKRSERILNKEMIYAILCQSVAIFLTVFAAFQIGRALYPDVLYGAGEIVEKTAEHFHFFALPGYSPSDGARTLAFVTLICAELLRAYTSRSERRSVFSLGLFKNKTMVKATLFSFLLLIVVLYLPFLEPVFHTVAPNVRDWVIMIVLSLIPFACGEIFKFFYYRKERG